jgi:hypothetical protein
MTKLKKFLEQFNKIHEDIPKIKNDYGQKMYNLDAIEIPEAFWNLLLKDPIFKDLAEGRTKKYSTKYPNVGGIKVIKATEFNAIKSPRFT